MSGVMLHGVLNMPISRWRDDPIDQFQRHSRYVEASQLILDLEDKIQALESSAPAELLESLPAPNTMAGHRGGFLGLHGRPPTDQEIWNGGVRSGINRTEEQYKLKHPLNMADLSPVTISKADWLQKEKGMTLVGLVLMDKSGKRATVDMGKVIWTYDEADKTVLLSQLESALHECFLDSEEWVAIDTAITFVRQLNNDYVEKLHRIIAAAYIIAGEHNASDAALEVFSDPDGTTEEQLDALIPYKVTPKSE